METAVTCICIMKHLMTCIWRQKGAFDIKVTYIWEDQHGHVDFLMGAFALISEFRWVSVFCVHTLCIDYHPSSFGFPIAYSLDREMDTDWITDQDRCICQTSRNIQHEIIAAQRKPDCRSTMTEYGEIQSPCALSRSQDLEALHGSGITRCGGHGKAAST